MPAASRTSGSPMPDSWSRCGEWTAPALSSTSRVALSVRRPPFVALMTHAGGAAVHQLDPLGQRAGEHGEVGALLGRAQVTVGGAPAPAAMLVDRRRCVAVDARLVQLGEAGEAVLPAGLEERGAQRVGIAQLLDVERAADAVDAAGIAADPVLRAPEVGQDVVVGPAGDLLAPTVVVDAGRREPTSGRSATTNRRASCRAASTARAPSARAARWCAGPSRSWCGRAWERRPAA